MKNAPTSLSCLSIHIIIENHLNSDWPANSVRNALTTKHWLISQWRLNCQVYNLFFFCFIDYDFVYVIDSLYCHAFVRIEYNIFSRRGCTLLIFVLWILFWSKLVVPKKTSLSFRSHTIDYTSKKKLFMVPWIVIIFRPCSSEYEIKCTNVTENPELFKKLFSSFFKESTLSSSHLTRSILSTGTMMLSLITDPLYVNKYFFSFHLWNESSNWFYFGETTSMLMSAHVIFKVPRVYTVYVQGR